MTAYLIVQIDVTDHEAYAEYIKRAPAVVAAHGGSYLARGTDIETLEGEPYDKRIALLSFPSVEAARGFYESEQYQEVATYRQGAATGLFLLMDGVD